MSEKQVSSDFVGTRWFGLMILLLPLTHVALSVKRYWDRWQCEHSLSVVSLLKHDITLSAHAQREVRYLVASVCVCVCVCVSVKPNLTSGASVLPENSVT